MKISNHIFLASLLIALINACKKQNIDPLSQLPPATQTGEDTFGCLVNGRAVVLKDGSFWTSSTFTSGYINENTYYLNFYANGNETPEFTFFIDSLKVSEGATYKLSKFKVNGFASAAYNANINAKPPLPSFATNDNVTGSLTITKNSILTSNGPEYVAGTHIIAGTFYFNAVDDKGDTVKVTNGRFDIPE